MAFDLMISDTNKEKIKAIVLNDEEREAAYFEGQKKKYFHEKFKPYWDEQEHYKEKVKQLKK